MENGTSAAPTQTTPSIIREPGVYLVGRQDVDRGEIDRFLGDHGMTWETDTEVGAEQLVEAGGRLCYVCTVRAARRTRSTSTTSSCRSTARCWSTRCGTLSSPASPAPSRTS